MFYLFAHLCISLFFFISSSTAEMNTHDAIANTVTRAAINLRASDDNDSDGVVVVVSVPLLLSARSLRQSVRSGKITSRQSVLNAARFS
jgi:hypothetical protein